MDKKEMTNEENYHFDVAGYLLLPGVLKKAEVKACNEALEQPGTGAGAGLAPTQLQFAGLPLWDRSSVPERAQNRGGGAAKAAAKKTAKTQSVAEEAPVATDAPT